MASFRPYTGGVSGKLGGVVFAHAKCGKQVRGGPSSKPRTTAQSRRGVTLFARASSFWSRLSTIFKTTWIQRAGLEAYLLEDGGADPLTGYALSLATNIRLLAAGFDPVSVPPDSPPPGIPEIVGIQFIDQTRVLITTFPSGPASGQAWVVYISWPFRDPPSPRSMQGHRQRQKFVATAHFPSVSPFDITLPHWVAPGHRVTFWLDAINIDGSYSPRRWLLSPPCP